MQLDGLIPSDDDVDGDGGDCDADVVRMATVMLISKIANKNKGELPVNHHSRFRSKNDDFPTITSRFSAGSLLTKIPLPEKGSFQCGEKNVSKENRPLLGHSTLGKVCPQHLSLAKSIFDH